MQEMKQLKIFCAKYYGGLPFINMIKIFSRVAASVRDLGNLLGEMKFPWFHK
jgi:hypothetical protein